MNDILKTVLGVGGAILGAKVVEGAVKKTKLPVPGLSGVKSRKKPKSTAKKRTTSRKRTTKKK